MVVIPNKIAKVYAAPILGQKDHIVFGVLRSKKSEMNFFELWIEKMLTSTC